MHFCCLSHAALAGEYTLYHLSYFGMSLNTWCFILFILTIDPHSSARVVVMVSVDQTGLCCDCCCSYCPPGCDLTLPLLWPTDKGCVDVGVPFLTDFCPTALLSLWLGFIEDVLYLLWDGSLENADIPEYFISVYSLPNTICENYNLQFLRCFLSQALFIPNSTPQDATHTTFTSAPRLATDRKSVV